MRPAAVVPVLAVLLAACGGPATSGGSVLSLGRNSDLTVVAVTFDPPAPRVGERVRAAVQWVDLAADAPFPAPITIDLVVQPDGLGRVCSWETREALGTVTCEFPGWAEPGTFGWDAWVDTLKIIEEPNEGNNTLGGTVTVEP